MQSTPLRLTLGLRKGDAEAPGVLLQRLHRVEAHGLVVDLGREELHWVVTFQPGGLVGGNGEGVGVALGEHVLAVDLGEDLFRRCHPARHCYCCPIQKTPLVHGDEVGVVGLGEGPAYLVSLGGSHARHVHDELHHLFLPDDDAAAPLQGPLLQRDGRTPKRHRGGSAPRTELTALPCTPTPGRMRATW